MGGRRVGGEQLHACFEALAGIEWAESCLASRNVVFDYSGRRKEPSLSAAIEAELGQGSGFQSSVFLRDRERFLDLSRTEPFSTATAIDRLHGPGTTRIRSTIKRMAKKYFGE